MHKADAFFGIVISFLLGTLAASFIPTDSRFPLFALIVGIILIAVSGYHRTFAKTKRAARNRTLGVVAGVFVLIAGLGALRYQSFALSHGILDEFASRQAGGRGVPVLLEGYVDEEPGTTASGKRQVVLRTLSLTAGDRTIATNERTLLIGAPSLTYAVGQTLSVSGALEIPKNFAADFDYIQYLRNRDIRTVMFTPRVSENPDLALGPWHRFKAGFHGRLFGVKNAFETSIARTVPEPNAAYLNGILLGSRDDIPQELKDAFNKTGTTHILAISGYNIAIIAKALLAALVFFMLRRKAFWASVVCIILFTLLTGATASVVRAAIMGLLFLFASGYGRLHDPRNAITFAAGAMVLLQPSTLRFDIGFQLSFLAVLGLMYLYPVLESRTASWPEWRGLKEILLMTVSAQFAVAPLLVYYFHQFSVVSLLANALILPVMPFAMLFGFLAGAAGFIAAPLGFIVGLPAHALSSYQLGAVSLLAEWPYASVPVGIGWTGMLAAYAVIILAFRRLSST